MSMCDDRSKFCPRSRRDLGRKKKEVHPTRDVQKRKRVRCGKIAQTLPWRPDDGCDASMRRKIRDPRCRAGKRQDVPDFLVGRELMGENIGIDLDGRGSGMSQTAVIEGIVSTLQIYRVK